MRYKTNGRDNKRHIHTQTHTPELAPDSVDFNLRSEHTVPVIKIKMKFNKTTARASIAFSGVNQVNDLKSE